MVVQAHLEGVCDRGKGARGLNSKLTPTYKSRLHAARTNKGQGGKGLKGAEWVRKTREGEGSNQ